MGGCFLAIHDALSWSQGTVDFAYQLAKDWTAVKWLRSQFKGWQRFREQTLAALKSHEHVVFCDISAFYENIDIGLLVSDLRSSSAPPPAVEQISACLNRWAQVPGRGIPQGTSASDILAKLYLNAVDQNLETMGREHQRYVDDIRIFCKDEVDAKRALVDLVELLRRRGLNIQSAKTEVLTASEATERLEHVIQAVTEVGHNLRTRIREVFGTNPYINIPEVDKILTDNPDEAPVEILEQAYVEFFADPHRKDFDYTLFRFVLKRLEVVGSKAPLLYDFLEFLWTHPEETHTVLGFLEQLGVQDDQQDSLVDFVRSDRAVYPYQVYQIVGWLGRTVANPSGQTIGLARRLAFDNTRPDYVRAVARRLVGERGNQADLERLEALYGDAPTPLEQAELICSLVRMERGRRNGFLARVEKDGALQRRAVRFVRQQQE